MFSHFWKTQFLFKGKEKNTHKRDYFNFKTENLLKDVIDLNLKDQLSEISDLNEKYNN